MTLTLSLLIRQSADDPWNRAFAAANGPHVVYYAASDVDLSRVAGIEGVRRCRTSSPPTGDSSLVRENGKYELALLGLGPDSAVRESSPAHARAVAAAGRRRPDRAGAIVRA